MAELLLGQVFAPSWFSSVAFPSSLITPKVRHLYCMELVLSGSLLQFISHLHYSGCVNSLCGSPCFQEKVQWINWLKSSRYWIWPADNMTLGSHVDCIENESSCPHTICNMPDVLVAQVLGTPTREEIKCMNPNYTEFKFPQIKAHPWHKVCNLLNSLCEWSMFAVNEVCNLVYWKSGEGVFVFCLTVLCIDLGLPQAHATWSCWPGLKTSSIFSKLAILCCMYSCLFPAIPQCNWQRV